MEFSLAAKTAAEARFPDGSLDFFQCSDFNVDCSSIQLVDELAKGSYGTVYAGVMRGETYAVKIEEFSDGVEEQVNLLVELTVLQSLPHEKMVRFFGAGYLAKTNVGATKIMILMELCKNGALREALKLSLPWNLRVRMALEIVQGLAFLHEQSIIHRDIKTTNALIDDDWHAKLCDFSFACHEESTSKREFVYGTDEFMAPEIALALDFDKSADIFSFGIVLCEMITCREPSEKFLRRRAQDMFAVQEKELRAAIQKGCPEGLEALALQCCDVEPRNRPTAQMCVDELEVLLNDMGGPDIEFTPIQPAKQQVLANAFALVTGVREGHVHCPKTTTGRDLPAGGHGGAGGGGGGGMDSGKPLSGKSGGGGGFDGIDKNNDIDARFTLLEVQVQELRAENRRLNREMHAMMILYAERDRIGLSSSPSWSRRSGGGSSSVRLGGGGGGSRQRSNSNANKLLSLGMTMGLGNASGSSCRPPASLKSGSGESSSRRYSATVGSIGISSGGSGVSGGAGGTVGGTSVVRGNISIAGELMDSQRSLPLIKKSSSSFVDNPPHINRTNSPVHTSTALTNTATTTTTTTTTTTVVSSKDTMGVSNDDGGDKIHDEDNDEEIRVDVTSDVIQGTLSKAGIGRDSALLLESTSYDDMSMIPNSEEETTRIKTAILEAAEQIVLEAVQQQQQQQQQQQRSMTAMTSANNDQRDSQLETHHTLSSSSSSSSTHKNIRTNTKCMSGEMEEMDNSSSMDTGKNPAYGGTWKENVSRDSPSSVGVGGSSRGMVGGLDENPGGKLMLSRPEDLDHAMLGAQMMHLQRQLDMMKAQLVLTSSSPRNGQKPSGGNSSDHSGEKGGNSGGRGSNTRTGNFRRRTNHQDNDDDDDDAFDLARGVGTGRSQPLRPSDIPRVDLLQSDGEYSENQSLDMDHEQDQDDDLQTHFRKHNKTVTLNDRPSVLVFPEDRFVLEDQNHYNHGPGKTSGAFTAPGQGLGSGQIASFASSPPPLSSSSSSSSRIPRDAVETTPVNGVAPSAASDLSAALGKYLSVVKNFSISALRTGGKGTSSGGGTPTMRSGSSPSPVSGEESSNGRSGGGIHMIDHRDSIPIRRASSDSLTMLSDNGSSGSNESVSMETGLTPSIASVWGLSQIRHDKQPHYIDNNNNNKDNYSLSSSKSSSFVSVRSGSPYTHNGTSSSTSSSSNPVTINTAMLPGIAGPIQDSSSYVHTPSVGTTTAVFGGSIDGSRSSNIVSAPAVIPSSLVTQLSPESSSSTSSSSPSSSPDSQSPLSLSSIPSSDSFIESSSSSPSQPTTAVQSSTSESSSTSIPVTLTPNRTSFSYADVAKKFVNPSIPPSTPPSSTNSSKQKEAGGGVTSNSGTNERKNNKKKSSNHV